MRRTLAGWISGVLLLLALGGCSYDDYVESKIPAEDRAFVMRFMKALESEDAATVEAVAGGEVSYFDRVGQGNKRVRRTSIREIGEELEKNGFPKGTPPTKGVYKNLVPKGATYRFIRYDPFAEKEGFFVQLVTDHQGTTARFSIYVNGRSDTKTGKQRIGHFDKETNPNLTQYNRDKYRYEVLMPIFRLIGITVLIALGPAIWFIVRTMRRARARALDAQPA